MLVEICGLLSKAAHGPPRDPDVAAATRPYHELNGYMKVPWFFEEQGTPSSLDGKVALVVGATSGIGKAVAMELYARGCTVVITGRSHERAQNACTHIAESTTQQTAKKSHLHAIELDLVNLEDVRRFTKSFTDMFQQLHFLVLNAGGIPPPGGGQLWKTTEGFEGTYVANYLGHFLLLNLLLPILRSSAPARVSVTSSIAHWAHASALDEMLPNGYFAGMSLESKPFKDVMQQYGNTKFLQVVMCFEMQRRLRGQGITITPVIPGLIATAIGRSERGVDPSKAIFDPFSKSLPPFEGAKTTLHALLSPSMANREGFIVQPYYSPLHRSAPRLFESVLLHEIAFQRRTWGCYLWLPDPDVHRTSFAAKLFETSQVACNI